MATGEKTTVAAKGGRPRSRPVCPAGERIVRYAKSRGLNLNELAAEAGLNCVTVYAIVGGQTPDPRVSTLRALADALGVSLDRLWPRAR